MTALLRPAPPKRAIARCYGAIRTLARYDAGMIQVATVMHLAKLDDDGDHSGICQPRAQ